MVKDSFWECVIGAETFERFKENYVPKFTFKSEVSEDVINSFKIVEKLITHSYFEYDFLDPALTKAMTSLEMALKYRYEELTQTKWKGTLQKLLYYFNDAGYFEFFRKELMDALRRTRNIQSHPMKPFGGGFGVMVLFTHCLDLINDTYEDRALRKQRMDEKNNLNEQINEYLKSGGILIKNNTPIPLTIYECEIFFINNISTGKIYYGFYKCTFRLEDDQEVNDRPSSLYFFTATSFMINSSPSRITFHCINEYLEITPILNLNNRAEYNNWNNRFKKSEKYIMYDLQLNYKIGKYWMVVRKSLHSNGMNEVI